MRTICALFLLLFFYRQAVKAQSGTYQLITSDVVHFWEAVDSLKPHCDSAKIFQQVVLDRASPSFAVFVKKWNIRAPDYVRQLRKFPRFYASLRKNSMRLILLEDSIRKNIDRFKKLYPGFKDADICVAFGNFSTGGNVEISKNKNRVYIGLEFHGLDAGTDIGELPVSLRDYVSRSDFMGTVLHELVHVQQQTHGKKIQRACYGGQLQHRILREGIPEFVAHLLLGDTAKGNFVVYGMKNELALKTVLKAELETKGSGSWFGGADSLFVNKPRDLGYFMGSRIAGAYYKTVLKNTSDISALIEFRNAGHFIRDSRYFE